MRTDEEIVRELERATTGLLFMSESDYPVEVFRLEGAEGLTHDLLRRKAGADGEAAVVVQSVEDFFRVAAGEQEWKGAAELETARRYQALVGLLKSALEDVRVYRVGEINIGVYVVGRSPAGNWLGVSTRVVET
ncbi:MAG TPA: nuclease A inhibitor family protein [Pyrinomonadaceae bacterium]|nr:nuclease A inhibitor family protein [Pyrinomonadaceae bacterium]